MGVGIPIYGRDELIHIHDCASPLSAGGWTAGNEMASRILRCLEAVRDLDSQAAVLLLFPMDRRPARLVKSLAIPIFTLYELTSAMLNTLRNTKEMRRSLTKSNILTIDNCLKVLREIGLDKQCELALIRDKIAAHVDDASAAASDPIWQKVDLRKFVNWAVALIAAASQVLPMDVFAWTEAGTPDNIWHIMSADGTVLHLERIEGASGEDRDFPWRIEAVELVQSPKIAISNELLAARTKCLELIGYYPANDLKGTDSRPL